MATAPPTSIRFPPELRAKVEARAQAERRTFSNFVIVLVEQGLAATSADGRHAAVLRRHSGEGTRP